MSRIRCLLFRTIVRLPVTVCIRIWSRDMDLKTLKLFNSQLRCGWLLYIWNRAFMAHLRVSANR